MIIDQNIFMTKEHIDIPEKFQDIVKKIESLTVIELAELVKILEEKFGVSAQSIMTTMPAAGEGAQAIEEKTAFDVILSSAGDQKIQVIKVIREVTGLGLKESKDLADSAPKPVKQDIKKEEAEDLKKKLEAAGATAEIK